MRWSQTLRRGSLSDMPESNEEFAAKMRKKRGDPPIPPLDKVRMPMPVSEFARMFRKEMLHIKIVRAFRNVDPMPITNSDLLARVLEVEGINGAKLVARTSKSMDLEISFNTPLDFVPITVHLEGA